jgi:5-methylcytosine-specific restriction endonuclease McrA
MMRNVMRSPVLVLNASYEPLHICAARRALTLIVKDCAVIQHDTGRQVHVGIMFPSVIRLKRYARVPHRAQEMTRKNILMRDDYRCQYCGVLRSGAELTLDHILPRAQGGLSTWENLVAACGECNRRKGNQTPEEAGMPLLRRPRPVTLHTARGILRAQASDEKVWQKYLFYDNTGCQEGVTFGPS